MISRNKRPIIAITPTPTDRIVEVVAALGVALGITTLLSHWHELPERIPTHFNAWGKPDGWGQKFDLLLLEGLVVFMYLLFTVLNRFPHIFNYPVAITQENASRQYAIWTSSVRWLKLEVVWLITYTLWGTIQISLGRQQSLNPTILWAILASTTATLGLTLIKSYRAR